MNSYECENLTCVAKKMPAIRPYWTQSRREFEGFIKKRMTKSKFTVESKALIIINCGKMYRIMSGQYFVFRSDGERLVMFPSSFHDVWKQDVK